MLPDARPPAGDLLPSTLAALGEDTALLSFQLSDSVSWLYAVDRDGPALYRLAPRSAIESQLRAASQAIRDDAPGTAASSYALYRTLFGALPERFQKKSRWLLDLDPALFSAPLAALVESPGPRPAYLVETHTIEVIPGAGYWVDSLARPWRRDSRMLVGVGDPIYNMADPRAAGRPAAVKLHSPFRLLAAPLSQSPAILLPRLVASARELDASASAWAGDHLLLEGAEACRRNLAGALGRSPAVVHFATHILPTGVTESHGGQESASSPYGLIALSLTEKNETELLSPAEIAHWKVDAGLVVLSGCYSAAGPALPGTGVLGLTRAWLAAGAHSVMGTRWDIPDNDGALFSAFYRNLSSRRLSDPARALRAAQLEMLRSGGPRARPRYWGAYFLVGNP